MTDIMYLKNELSTFFKKAVKLNDFDDFMEKARPLLSSFNDTDLKSIVELTIREVLVELISLDTDISYLELVFQFSIEAAVHDLAPGNVPVLVLGDMFESSTIVQCEKIFAFVESRVETFKKDLFFKSCKNHLLRSCNDLLRRLSRSQNTVFCGRILLFLARIFPLSERSGLNIISEFNYENTTVYSTNDDIFSDMVPDKGDSTEEEGEITSRNQSPIVADKNLYQKFWSLQDFFRSPTTCYNKIQWKKFASCTADILTVFGSFKSDDANSSKWKQAKLPSPNGACVYFAKYLTSPKLLELELSDSHFRRYVLVQFLILFQYLTSPVKFKLEFYILTDDQQSWLKDTTKKVYKLLEETPPNGTDFAQDVEKILLREEYWNAWKNEGCPDFKQVTEKIDLEKRGKKRPLEELHTYKPKLNSDLIKLWSTTPNNWEACRNSKRNFIPSLESFFGISSGKIDSSYKRNLRDSKYAWKALRLLCMKSPHIFTSNSVPAKSVPEYLENVIQKMVKDKPPVQQDMMTAETAGEDSIEDGNDEFLPASEEDSKDERVKKDVLTRSMIETLSSKIQTNWRALSIQLGFQDDEIEYFEESFPKSKLQVQEMLTVWMERDGSLSVLTKALQSAGLSNVIPLLSQQD
ncbi:THO complex subunit 1-like [Uloborus diversus]|uniref:THO complex subunit 1-like n=1 Tax=Uloborus diversus TaxID=327109 RepID=UPI00240A3631|nr:THO complex subunit 1-like [Uloborus diversus]